MRESVILGAVCIGNRTQNVAYRFFGTMGCIGQDSARAWAIALPLVQAATGCPDWAARDFLDSRDGRHFADEVARPRLIRNTKNVPLYYLIWAGPHRKGLEGAEYILGHGEKMANKNRL